MKAIGWVLGVAAVLAIGCGSSDGSGGDGSGGSSGAKAGGSGPASGGSGPGAGGAPASTTCAADATEITALPACAAPASSTIDVASGCAPTVDGTLHAAEWADATCFVVGSGDMTVNVKYAGDTLYLATSGTPTCGCPFFLELAPTPGATLGADAFAIGLFDDPGGVDGDRFDLMASGGAFVMGAAPAAKDIVTRCPGMSPNPVRYEVSIPLASLGITAGQPHAFGLGILHSGVGWPAGLTADSGMLDSSNAAAFGQLSSQASWK